MMCFWAYCQYQESIHSNWRTNVFHSLHNSNFSMQQSSSCINIVLAAEVDYFDSKRIARSLIKCFVDCTKGSVANVLAKGFNVLEDKTFSCS